MNINLFAKRILPGKKSWRKPTKNPIMVLLMVTCLIWTQMTMYIALN